MKKRTMLAVLATLVAGVGLSPAAPPAEAAGTPNESITYVTPIWEGGLATNVRANDLAALNSMKSRLGTGGAYTKLGWSFSSWALSRDINGAGSNYTFNATNLNYMLGLAVDTSLPVLVHMNDGRWADCCNSNSSGGWGDALLDTIAAQPNTVMTDSAGNSRFGHNFGSNYFSLSRLNTVYRDYKKRNLQSSASTLAAWAASHPGLFVGVSLDSETMFPDASSDYSVLTVEEWRQWLQNTGIYGPGGAYFGQGRTPAFTSIGAFNSAMGTSFGSWAAVQPPTNIAAHTTFVEEWSRWRVVQIEHHVADLTTWIASAGIDRNLVYGHQTPQLDYYQLGDDSRTNTAANGAGGVTYYGWDPALFGRINNPLRADGKNNWGVFELNPLTTDATRSYNTMVTLFNDGIKVICPNAWEPIPNPDQYSMINSPTTGDTFGNAVQSFLANYGNTPRNAQPTPWNPGTLVYDFTDNFASATKSGPDNHVEAAASVGGVTRRGIFSHVGGTITYTVALPSVASGQRLNLWNSIGIRDDAGVGDNDFGQVTINGAPLYGTGLTVNKSNWQWKRWTPAMVDVTPWAGSTVTITFTTTGSSIYGWTVWGSPAIYATTASQNNLAAGKPVSVSSTDGTGAAGWDQSYLTDGNVDGGSAGRNGWSSVSHASAAGVEWASIDLGAANSVRKVVLFPRSDVVTQASTGFPSDFLIQGSLNGTTWSTLSTLTSYQDAKAGQGQIFTFAPQSARYIRIYATKLGGVGSESGYRMQLTDAQVFG
jgi:hypothetical protein